MYPVGDYLDMSCLPEYGMAVHLYLTNKKIQKVTFSLFKMYLQNGDMAVVPVDVLLERMEDRREREELIRDVNSLCRRITGKTIFHEQLSCSIPSPAGKMPMYRTTLAK